MDNYIDNIPHAIKAKNSKKKVFRQEEKHPQLIQEIIEQYILL